MKTKGAIIVSFALACLAQAAPPVAPGKPMSVQVGTDGDQLAFDHPLLKAKAGQSIRLTFKNNASPGSSMQHAWFLLKPGTEDQVADAAANAGAEKGYDPGGDDILARTRLLNPGESQTIVFTSPTAPGEYPFICPFPGHHISMKGKLEVK